MSILIKNIKMPKDQPLRMILYPNGQLFVDHGIHFTEYEAIAISRHGDLIEREPLKKSKDLESYYENVKNAPTIISAEEE